MTREELLLASLNTTADWREFEIAAGELVAEKNVKALPVLVRRALAQLVGAA